MRKLVIAALATLSLAALAAAPASAKDKAPEPPYTYTATIDCGHGPVVVGSYDDIWADLEDLRTGRRYHPIEWHVSAGDVHIDLVKEGAREKRPVTCSYDDGFVTGTVVVRRDLGRGRGRS